jgi:signal transduction histidine kinase
MKDDQGVMIGAVAVGRDLTERRKLEHQLRQSHKLAALGVMAGGIAHEIRNPLAVCSSAAQFLMEDDLPEDIRHECTQQIQSGLQKVSQIIENMLRFARPSMQDEMGELDLVTVLRETLTLIDNQARVQKVRVHARLPEHPVTVRGVPSLLQQVFMNLFLNAIQAMPDGGELAIEMDVRGGPGAHLRPLPHQCEPRLGHGPRPVDLLRDRAAPPGFHQCAEHPG